MRSLGIWSRIAAVAACTTLATMCAAPGRSGATGFVTRKEALARTLLVAPSGDLTQRWTTCAKDDETFDLRGLASTGNFDLSNLSIGNDCAGAGTVVIGGTVTGAISHKLTWADVKSAYDGAALRLEGNGWIAAYDLAAIDVEDGFRPRVPEGTQQDNTVSFLLAHAYMTWIRDDAVEDDDLMSGTIRNCLIDGTNRFLSARPMEGTDYTNHGMVVTVHNVLVHMKAMPNDRAEDGLGFGGIFKWSDAAGSVDVSDSIFLLDERPIADEPFPAGTYRNVTLVLGPNFSGDYPTALPPGVTVTRDLRVWRDARHTWLSKNR